VPFKTYNNITNQITFYPNVIAHVGNFTIIIKLSLDCNGNFSTQYTLGGEVVNLPPKYNDSSFSYRDIDLGVNCSLNVTIPPFYDPEGFKSSIELYYDNNLV
jgi:hypothetical protein